MVLSSLLRPLYLVGPGFQKVKGKAPSRLSSADGGTQGAAAVAAAAKGSEPWAEFRHPQFRRGRRDLLMGITRQKDPGRLRRRQGTHVIALQFPKTKDNVPCSVALLWYFVALVAEPPPSFPFFILPRNSEKPVGRTCLLPALFLIASVGCVQDMKPARPPTSPPPSFAPSSRRQRQTLTIRLLKLVSRSC